MNAPERILPDIQSEVDHRSIAIDRVGVTSMLHPISVAAPRGAFVSTVANVDMYVGLPPHQKGTHMSRFVEILQGFEGDIDYYGMHCLMLAMLDRLEAESGWIELRFPYFISKIAPVSGVASLLDYHVSLRAEMARGISDLGFLQRAPTSDGFRLSLKVQVPVTSLCPCSKEISAYGAHNQRSHVTITAELAEPTSIEELVGVAEQEASCELYGLLKRPDEKYVTERAYDNPKFVEDMVRDVAGRLDRDDRVRAYVVESENFESIHNHSAYALIENRKG
jgi:GTP cyclohydrolase IB